MYIYMYICIYIYIYNVLNPIIKSTKCSQGPRPLGRPIARVQLCSTKTNEAYP